MEKVHVNFMKDLRNHEFVELYNIIINYIEKQEVDDANVKIAFEKVKSHRVKLLDLEKRKRSKFSIRNRKLTRKRNEYLISLRLRVQSYLLSQIPAERDAAKQIDFVIKSYGREYYVATIVPQTIFVDDMEHRLKHNKKNFREAVSLLKLNDLINTITDMTVEIMANYKQRVNEDGETKSKREGVKNAAYLDMKIMADAINFMAIVNRHNEEKKAVVEELINNIDGILKDFRTQMKSRYTKRKNRKAVETAVQELINSQRERQGLLPGGVVDR
ncbi:MAG TPA: DUF6261 family protein [Dysgonamonadaceae bacterium]|nr:DUF6261 family protein [Dysgonamonadaceae bacterium]